MVIAEDVSTNKLGDELVQFQLLSGSTFNHHRHQEDTHKMNLLPQTHTGVVSRSRVLPEEVKVPPGSKGYLRSGFLGWGLNYRIF